MSKHKGSRKKKEKVEQIDRSDEMVLSPESDLEKMKEMPEEEKIVLLKPMTPQAGQGDIPANMDDWMISVSMKNRSNAILHIAGLMNLIVSLELIGESATKDPNVEKNTPVKEIYAHNINEAQTLAMLHVTQLVVQHQISWDEVLESMVADYMRNIAEPERTKQKEDVIRAQAYSVISTGYKIINRCRNAAIARVGGSGAMESKST